jgi:Trp operon repressor
MASNLQNTNYGKHCMNLVLGQRKALVERVDIVNQRINKTMSGSFIGIFP